MQLQLIRYLPNFIRSRIEKNPQLQDIFGNTGWMAGDSIIRKAVGLLIGVLLARYLGPQLYGELSYAIAFVLIISPIATLAMDSLSIRRIVQDFSSTNEVLGTSFKLMLGGGIFAFIIAMAGIFLVRPEDRLTHWLVGILAAGNIVQAFIAIEYWFGSQMQWKFPVYAKNSAFLLISIVKIGLIILQAPLVAFAWASLAETALGSVGLLIVYKFRGYTWKNWRFNRTIARSMLQDGWPLILSAFLTMVYQRIDQVMLGNMVGSIELGHYSVAVQLSEVWYFIPLAFCGAVFPAIVKAEAFSEELLYARLQKLYNLMAFITYIVAIPIAFFADEIVKILFSAAYKDTAPLLTILVWTGLFSNLIVARNLFMVAKNWTRINLAFVALGCVMNIILNVFLIPVYGAMGAVAATFISYWFTAHGSCFLVKSLRKTGWMITKAMLYPKIW